jgi:hypothetical protein
MKWFSTPLGQQQRTGSITLALKTGRTVSNTEDSRHRTDRVLADKSKGQTVTVVVKASFSEYNHELRVPLVIECNGWRASTVVERNGNNINKLPSIQLVLYL